MARTPQRKRYYYAFAYGPLFVVSLSSEYVTSTHKGPPPPPPARTFTPAHGRVCACGMSACFAAARSGWSLHGVRRSLRSALCGRLNGCADSPEWRWLVRTLASVDRARTPWLVVLSNHPMYCTASAHKDRCFKHGEASGLRHDLRSVSGNGRKRERA